MSILLKAAVVAIGVSAGVGVDASQLPKVCHGTRWRTQGIVFVFLCISICI
jgi:hypothetical protein